VQFGVLGSLRVMPRDLDDPGLALAPRLRVLLAVLLWRANHPVAVDDLAELVWDGVPPAGAAEAIRALVMRLRRRLSERAAPQVVTRAPGYAIEVGTDELDASRFETLAADAGAALRACRWEDAAQTAAEALGLWRGSPLADVPSQILRDQWAPHLEQLHIQVLEWRVEADLNGGHHERLIPELRDLVSHYPLREHFHAQLMLALARSGRRAEALGEYQRARRTLDAELGIAPGAELRQLHERVLAEDASLIAPAAAPAEVSPEAAATVPRQLPAAPRSFVGRHAEVIVLSRLAEQAGAPGGSPGTVVISAIDGMAGVGKTALALHWAHQVADQFPDGQLYCDLRGFDPSGTPVPPQEAIRGFLGAFQVPPEQVPASLANAAGLYRSLVAGQKMLIVLDNARDADQVRPLLPASLGCLVVVTSRRQLAGLAAVEGARLLNLDVLTAAEARELLTRRLGPERAAAEPHAVDELAVLCGRLPLALAITAARAATQPDHPLSTLAAELRGEQGRLDALDTADPNATVRAVFSWSHRQLDVPAAQLFRMLGLHPGPDVTIPAAAGLTGTRQDAARRALRELTAANLLTERLPGRYALHDLLRAYAAEQARHTDSDTDRREAIGRMLDHYLHTAAHASLLLDPAKEPVTLAPPRPGAACGQPADRRQAVAWFAAEHQVLLAAVTLAAGAGFDSHAWQLAWAMSPFLQARGHYPEWAVAQRTALAAATRLGDTAAQALSSRLLADACSYLGDHDQAHGHYASSLTLYQRLGDSLGQAKIQHSLSFAADRQGRYADALGHSEQALRRYQAIGDKASEAEALNAIGWYHGLLGDYQQARAFCRQALTLSTEAGHHKLEGHVWDSLGYAEHHLGNLAEAAACYQRALSLKREGGDRSNEADTLTHLGDTHHAAGDIVQARDAWKQALAILENLQHSNAAQVRARLSDSVNLGGVM